MKQLLNFISYFYQATPKIMKQKHGLMKSYFFWHLYLCISYILVLISLLRLWFKKKEHKGYTENWRERLSLHYPNHSNYLNHIDKINKENQQKQVCLHAVSVGETQAAFELIRYLISENYQVLLTQTTPSARDIALKTFAMDIENKNLRLQYFVYDCPYAVQKFFEHEKPDLFIIMETEFWPCLLGKLGELQIPTVLANARLSKKSWKKLRQFLAPFLPLYNHYHKIFAQSNMDAKRFADLIYPKYNINIKDNLIKDDINTDIKNKIKILGNLKFDQIVHTEKVNQGLVFRQELLNIFNKKSIIMLASTRDGEEKLLLDTWFENLNSNQNSNQNQHQILKDSLLLIVPRHLDRVPEIKDLINQFNHQGLCKSMGLEKLKELKQLKTSAENEKLASTSIIIGDTMGEMPFYIASSDVVVMGGTWGDFGGQNFLEAIAQGKPTIIGPSIYNFMQVAKNAIKHKACLQTELKTMPDMVASYLIQIKNNQNNQNNIDLIELKNNQKDFMQMYSGVLEKYKVELKNL